jgi:uncharacterized protein
MSDPLGQQQPSPPDHGADSAAVAGKDERTWAMLCHLTALAFFIPFGNIIGPLVVWLIKKDEFPLVNDQGKESLNFQITMMIGFVISIPLIAVFVGMVTGPVILVIDIVFVVKATIRANAGEAYRYPFALRLVK